MSRISASGFSLVNVSTSLTMPSRPTFFDTSGVFVDGSQHVAAVFILPWKRASAGFVGTSDGWQDLSKHKQMLWEFESAENGNVALTGEVNLEECINYSFVLSLGFGRDPEEAGMRARAALLENFDNCKTQFIQEWQKWQKKLYVFDNKTKKSQIIKEVIKNPLH